MARRIPNDRGSAPRSAGPPSYSLRRRLLVYILGASVVMWVVSLALIVHVAWRETSSVFDDSLLEGASLALVLGSSLQAQGRLAHSAADGLREPAKLKLYYQIVARDGHVVRRAAGAPEQPFSNQLQESGEFQNVWAQGRAWRVYLLRGDATDFQVQIGQPWNERLELLDDISEELVWPALLMLLLLGAFCWFVIRRLLSPVERTAARIAAKSPDDLEPVPYADDPRELQPLLGALNLVLGRLGRALQAERRFTADAAHELRTPLAALRMRIQLMQRQQAGTGGAVTRQPLQSLRDDVDHCTTLVENLLTLARLDPDCMHGLAKESVDLHALFARLARLAHGQAAERGITLTADAKMQNVRAQPALLESALRNLVDNATRYSPAGSRIQVTARAFGPGVRISVMDDGPGVPPADRARLTERFFRVLGSGESGSGLGLSIVARIAALHGAKLHFDAGLDGRGLGVLLDFPAQDA